MKRSIRNSRTTSYAEPLLTTIVIWFLLFFMRSCPCFASMDAMRKELGSAKLTWQAIGFQMGTAYLAALIADRVLRFTM